MRRRRMPTDQFMESVTLNNRTYMHYYKWLLSIAISRFKWENMPDTVNTWYLEFILNTNSMAVFFKDEVQGYLTLMVRAGYPFNVYGIPTQREAYAVDNYRHELTDKDSVLIYNNILHEPTQGELELYAYRLYMIKRAIDVNLSHSKQPVMITCTEEQKLTMENLMMKWEGNQPFIFGDRSLDLNGIKILPLQTEYVIDRLQQQFDAQFNEAMTYLGVPNLSIAKKERMITDEVQQQLGGTMAAQETALFERQRACEEINKMFGLNVSVDFNANGTEGDTDYQETILEMRGEG